MARSSVAGAPPRALTEAEEDDAFTSALLSYSLERLNKARTPAPRSPRHRTDAAHHRSRRY